MSSRLSPDEKLKVLRKAWGYVEVSRATQAISGWQIWLVKNYAGRPIQKMVGVGLPGNPKATRKHEYTGHTPGAAIQRAYVAVMNKKKGLKGKKVPRR